MQTSCYNFSVSGISCNSCVNRIKLVLQENKDIYKISLDVTGNLQLECELDYTLDNLEPYFSDESLKKFTFTLQKNCYLVQYAFTLQGLNSTHHALEVEKNISQQLNILESVDCNFRNSVLTVRAKQSNYKCNDEVIAAIIAIIKNISNDKVAASLNKYYWFDENQNKEKKHRDNALINGTICVVLFLASLFGVLPAPITLWGKVLHMGIGALSLGVIYKTGKSFFVNAWHNFRDYKTADMDTLVALGVGSAWVLSVLSVLSPYVLASGGVHWAATMMTPALVHWGRARRSHAESKGAKQVENLENLYFKFQPQLARKITPNGIVQVSYLDIKKGDKICIFPEERFPVDAKITSQNSTMVKQSGADGHSNAVFKKVNDEVAVGAVNLGKSAIEAIALNDGTKGKLHCNYQRMCRATSGKTSYSHTADLVAKYFAPFIIGLAVMTGIVMKSLILPISVLMAACPCSFVVGIPRAVWTTILKLGSRDMIVTNAEKLEELANVNTVVFDMLGTLTAPRVEEKRIKFANSIEKGQLLASVAAVEKLSAHPIAKELTRVGTGYYKYACLNPQNHEGKGVSGIVKKEMWYVGSRSFVATHCHFTEELLSYADICSNQGLDCVYVGCGERGMAIIPLQQYLLPESKYTIKAMQDMGKEVYILTGSNRESALRIGKVLGIDEDNIYANCLQTSTKHEKADKIEILKGRGKKVLMIGDGLNDTDPMDKANASVAFGTKASASATANIAINKISDIPALVLGAESMCGTISKCLILALGYNTVMLAFASGIMLSLTGIALSPIVATAAMLCSALVVDYVASGAPDDIDREWQKMPKMPQGAASKKLAAVSEIEDTNIRRVFYPKHYKASAPVQKPAVDQSSTSQTFKPS